MNDVGDKFDAVTYAVDRIFGYYVYFVVKRPPPSVALVVDLYTGEVVVFIGTTHTLYQIEIYFCYKFYINFKVFSNSVRGTELQIGQGKKINSIFYNKLLQCPRERSLAFGHCVICAEYGIVVLYHKTLERNHG